jgi:hypothetical protein
MQQEIRFGWYALLILLYSRHAGCRTDVDPLLYGVDDEVDSGLANWTIHSADANTSGIQATYHLMQPACMQAACSLQSVLTWMRQ